MPKLIACMVLLFSMCAVEGQDFSNKGKEFYLCFPNHVPNNGSNLATLSIYITSDKASSGTVTMGNGAFSSTFSIAANAIQEIVIPWNALIHISNAESNTVINKSIKIKTDAGQPAVVAYAQQWAGARSAATLLLPVNVLGKKYYAVSFTQAGANQGAFLGRSQFQIIAVKNNTVVTITPRKNGALAPPITITLPQAGDMYQYQSQDGSAATQDLTGTLIESVASGAGGCLPIAVFSGSSTLTFGSATCNTGSSYDPLFQQLYPTNTWGKNFGIVPFEGYPNGNPVRVLAADSNTRVFYNGALVATLNPGEFYPSGFSSTPPVLNTPTYITADKPVCITQYAQRTNCSGRVGGSLGDPDMVVLNPVEQNINDITIFSSTREAITEQWVNVLLKTIAIPSFRINGAAPTGPSAVWTPMATLPGYSYLRYSMIGIPAARIVADSGFNAIAYGWGNFESYAYSAGTNVKDLYQQVRVSSLYGIEEAPSVCTGSPFKFKISLPYLVDSIRWNLGALPGNPSPVLQAYSNPSLPSDADSITTVNGKTIYWYSLSTPFNFSVTGIFPVSISTYSSNAAGCGNEQLIDFELEVSNPPVANFNWLHNGCIDQTVQFNDITTTTKPVYKWYWNFGDPASGGANISAMQNPTHQFSAPGTYTVKFANITTPGCLSDTIIKQVVINPLPRASLAGDINICQNSPSPNVIFTGTVGTAPFTFTYNVNNGPAQTIVTTSGNSINLPVPTAAIGTFNYYLVSVKDAAGSAGCFQNESDTVVVKVLPLPTATIAGNTTICQNGASPVITFAGTGAATTPYTFSYNINGGATQTITTSAGNSITLPVSTAIPGTFIYNLVSVRDASAIACSQAQSVSVSVTVSPLPSAVISGSTEVCLNAVSPLITFSGSGSVAPYTFTYTLNGGANQTITSIGNTASIAVPTSTAGSYIYRLLSVRDASANSCGQAQVGNATIVVNPLAIANFNISSPTCISSGITFTDNSTPGVGTLSTWLWNFGDPASGSANTSSLQNPVHTFNTLGTYDVSLTVINSKGCSSLAISKTVTINPKPTAGFILPEVCLSDTYAQFTDTSKVASPSSISGWLWNFGDLGSGANNSSLLKNPQHSYTAVGSYNVTLTATTNAGCTDVITQPLFINGSFPVANFILNNTTSLCANDSVSINDASTVFPGSITKVEIYWDNAGQPSVFDTDNNPTSGKLYKHLYPNFQTPLTKVFTIRYRAYSGGVCVNDRLQNITLNAAPAVQFSVIPDVCLDAVPFQVTQARETGSVPGTAVFSGPGISSSGIFNPASVGPGTYRLFYRFTSTAGGCVDTVSQLVKVLAAPLADFSISAIRCEANEIDFIPSATTPEGTLTNWAWNFGDGSPVVNSPNTSTVSHTYTSAGTYAVSLIVTTSNGCRSTPKVTNVVVNALPFSAFSLPTDACLPSALVAYTNLSSAGTYAWNFGDPASGALNSSTAVNPTHIYTSQGPFNILLRTTNASGCVKDTTIIFSSIHPQPTANFITDLPAVCLGNRVVFTDASNPMDGTTTQWNWTLGNNTTQSSPTFSYTYPAAGNYTVGLVVTNNFGCTSSSFTKSVIVYPFPTVDAGVNEFVLEGGSVTLEPIVTGNSLTYLWEPSTYLSASNVAKPVSSPLADITYKVTVSNPGGCSASDTVFVKVLKGPQIPNTFSPNGDGINEKWIIQYLDTYPDNRIQVFTRTGQLVFESRGYKTPWNGTMNGKTLPIDTYYYIIEPGNGRKPITGYVTILK